MRTAPANRSPVMMLLLLVVTCGLYYPYWLYTTSRDMDDFLGTSEIPPIVHLLLFIFTGTLWGYVWDFMAAQRITKMQAQVGLPVQDDTAIYLVCDVLGAGPIAGLGIVVPLLEQSRLNEVYDAARNRTNPSAARF